MTGCYPAEPKIDDDILRKLGQWREDVISMVNALESRTATVELLFNTRQTIETWQKGCEASINAIRSALQTQSEQHNHHKSRIDSIKGAIEYFIKRLDELTDRVNYLHQQHTQEKFNLPSVGDLNKIVEKELKNNLREKHKDLQEKYQQLQIVLGEKTDKLAAAIKDLDTALLNDRQSRQENKELRDKNDLLADGLDRKQAEVNRLERRLNELVSKFNDKVGGHL